MLISYHKQEIHQWVVKYFKNKKGKLLDLASYGGELLIKIYNTKSKIDITGSDINLSHFEAPTKSIKLDLNKDFTKNKISKYDYVTAIEVIEHIENPFHFMRSINKILKKNGTLIISTPHVASFWSKLLFLFTDTFWSFNFNKLNHKEHNGIHHITFIHPGFAKYLGKVTGFKIKKVIFVNFFLPLPYIRIPCPIKIPAFSESFIMILEKNN